MRLVSADVGVLAGRVSGAIPTGRPAMDVTCCGAVDVDTDVEWLRFAVARVAKVFKILESCSLAAAVVTAGFLLSGPEKWMG